MFNYKEFFFELCFILLLVSCYGSNILKYAHTCIFSFSLYLPLFLGGSGGGLVYFMGPRGSSYDT